MEWDRAPLGSLGRRSAARLGGSAGLRVMAEPALAVAWLGGMSLVPPPMAHV